MKKSHQKKVIKQQKAKKRLSLKKWIQAKKAKASKPKNLSQKKTFFTFRARQAFIKLRQVFGKVSILNHFDLKHHICIETDVSRYAIDEIFNPLILNDLDRLHLMDFFS